MYQHGMSSARRSFAVATAPGRGSASNLSREPPPRRHEPDPIANMDKLSKLHPIRPPRRRRSCPPPSACGPRRSWPTLLCPRTHVAPPPSPRPGRHWIQSYRSHREQAVHHQIQTCCSYGVVRQYRGWSSLRWVPVPPPPRPHVRLRGIRIARIGLAIRSIIDVLIVKTVLALRSPFSWKTARDCVVSCLLWSDWPLDPQLSISS
jgi:hypothetical protein